MYEKSLKNYLKTSYRISYTFVLSLEVIKVKAQYNNIFILRMLD